MAKITIDKQLQNKIYNEKHIFIEEGIYTINKNLLIEAPSSIRGCNLASVYRGGGTPISIRTGSFKIVLLDATARSPPVLKLETESILQTGFLLMHVSI